METEKYFEMVESVLREYPTKYAENYFANKDDIIISLKEPNNKKIGGFYIHALNYITIYDNRCLPHELFHMAFRDKNKIGKRIWCDTDLYYGNGVSYTYMDKICHKSLTEGFAEYMSRKCSDFKGQEFSYFFVDLLISIYGEDILKYPLLNNPGGFFSDERFLDIFEFSFQLDTFDMYKEKLIHYLNYLDNNSNWLKEVEKEKVLENVEYLEKRCVKSLVSIFDCIVDEYKNCDCPNIDKEEFVNKLESFLGDSDNNIDCDIWNNGRTMIRERISKIKTDSFESQKIKKH